MRLDATRTPVSRSNDRRSGLEAGEGIPCRPNPEATLLVVICKNTCNSLMFVFILLVKCLVSQRF